MRCEVQSTWARAVLALLTLAQLAAPVWALYVCDFLTISLASDLVANGLTLQVIHQTHARHSRGQSACGACASATLARGLQKMVARHTASWDGTANSKLGRRCQAGRPN